MIIAACIVIVTLVIGVCTARIVRRRRYFNEPIHGRQQQRAELRRLAARAVGRAPVTRHTRRTAAREIARRAKEES